MHKPATIDADREIINDIRAGQPRRFGLLVERHKDRAMTLALRLVKHREDAEELVQDAFVKAFHSLDRFRGDARFSTWFYRILYNLCMTRVTRRKERFVGIGDEDVLDAVRTDEPDAGIDEQLEAEELRQTISSEIDGLPEKYRSAVVLFYVQEMSYEEMSSVLDVPLGTVKTNLFRARSLLRARVRSRLKEGSATHE